MYNEEIFERHNEILEDWHNEEENEAWLERRASRLRRHDEEASDEEIKEIESDTRYMINNNLTVLTRKYLKF
jgi:hypothetical protein